MFDFLVLNQVIDHLQKPATVLKRLAESVKPGGHVLLGNVINIASPAAVIFEDEYRLLAPNHLFYFSPTTLRRLLTEAGFSQIEIFYPFFSTPYYRHSWWWDAPTAAILHLLGKKNLSPPAPGNVMTAFAQKA